MILPLIRWQKSLPRWHVRRKNRIAFEPTPSRMQQTQINQEILKRQRHRDAYASTKRLYTFSIVNQELKIHRKKLRYVFWIRFLFLRSFRYDTFDGRIPSSKLFMNWMCACEGDGGCVEFESRTRTRRNSSNWGAHDMGLGVFAQCVYCGHFSGRLLPLCELSITIGSLSAYFAPLRSVADFFFPVQRMEWHHLVSNLFEAFGAQQQQLSAVTWMQTFARSYSNLPI